MTTQERIRRCILLEDMKKLQDTSLRLGLRDISKIKTIVKEKSFTRRYSKK